MIYQPPTGARDLLPLDVTQKRWIEHRLQQVFHRWSYHRIITPTLERLDTLTAGGAVRPESVIQVWDAEEGVLGLRPELTASIARAAVTRMSAITYPKRLYYIANIFRRQSPEQVRGQHEFYQAGVELLGASGVAADAEILLLLADGLAAIGLQDWHLILGDAGLTRSLLSDFPPALQATIRQALASLDRIQIETLPLEPQQRERALQLLELRGNPVKVLQKIHHWAMAPEQVAAVQHLKSLVELLQGHPSITLDLSLIQPFDYYTGLVFEIVSDAASGQRILAQGGRYDQLLGLYHPQGQQVPGIGFSLNVQDLQQVLLPMGVLPEDTQVSDYLVVAQSPTAIAAAFHQSQILRTDESLRVEVELLERSPAETRAYATRRGISQIAWVDGTGSVTMETVHSS
jgi:ATP phosphoribosyltransferase regulatory subunit